MTTVLSNTVPLSKKTLSSRPSAASGEIFAPQYKALFRYFINRYWLQAVSDYDLIGRAVEAPAADENK